MSLIIALGTNIGDKLSNLNMAKSLLQCHFKLISPSRIYLSPPSDYLDQPDFFNQVMEFEAPELSPPDILNILLKIENSMGRERNIPKGPRIIDLDILFVGTTLFKNDHLEIPHPRLFQRAFVLLPLTELPYYSVLKKLFLFPSFHSNLMTIN